MKTSIFDRITQSMVRVSLLLCVACVAFDQSRAVHANDLNIEVVTDPLPYFDDQERYPTFDPNHPNNKRPNAVTAVTSLGPRPMDGELGLLLTRTRFPAEDGHLDAVLWLAHDEEAAPDGRLLVQLTDAEGNVVAEHVVDTIPGPQLFFSPPIPEVLVGEAGQLVVEWQVDGRVHGRIAKAFRVDPARAVKRAGRVELTIPNTVKAVLRNAPVTVGVPFPRGVLNEERHVRLVDADGVELPLQTEVTGRWSRFGSVRWLLCHFTVDLDGEPGRVYLEYGPSVKRAAADVLDIDSRGGGFPRLETTWFRFEGGLAADVAGDGAFRRIFEGEGLLGAFVEHANLRPYDNRRGVRAFVDGTPHVVPSDVTYEIESHGPVQTTVRQRRWFELPETGDRFCQFDIRYVIHHESAAVRVFFTWIYTGNSDRDRISNMGWRFPLVETMRPMGFLASAEGDQWLKGDYLLQYDHDRFELADNNRVQEGSGRAPGVFAAEGEGLRFYVGVNDFWQNFPNELEFRDNSMFVHTWPRHGRPHSHLVQVEDAYRLWFAHEGQVLNLALPMAMTEGEFYRNHSAGEPHWAPGRPESLNAQGIAKTTEMWLYVTDDQTPTEQAARAVAGLSEASLRAVVDPRWQVDSGVFYEIHPHDPETFPEDEKIFEMQALSPIKQVERMNVYGKWIYGDLLREADLDTQTISSTYRIFRKGHWGWPYSWVPFARSGDLRYFNFAQAAMRMMTDVSFVHYVSDDVAEHFTSLPERRMWASYQPFRDRGWHNRNLIPWAGYYGPSTRMYADGGEYLWHAYYITGDHRAKEVLDVWAEVSKQEHPDRLGRQALTAAQNRARWPIHLQKQYIEMYEGTFDPWFIVAAHAIADMHLYRYENENWPGHPWNTGPSEFQRYTGDERHLPFLLSMAEHVAHWRNEGWASTASTLIPSVVEAARRTGDAYYLRRAAGLLDAARIATYTQEEPYYYQGYNVRGTTNRDMLFTSWYHRWAPLLMNVIAVNGGKPANPIYMPFSQTLRHGDVIAIRKEAGKAIPLMVDGYVRITSSAGEIVFEGNVGEAQAHAEVFTTQAQSSGEAARINLPASLAEGVYYVHFDSDRVTLPITPPDTPEALVVQEGQVGSGSGYVQYWFMVPEGVDTFTIRFDNPVPFRQAVRRITIWGPNNEAHWDYQKLAKDHDPEEIIEATVNVSAEHAGQFWRVSLPATRSVGFTLDPQLPPVLSHEPNRWFDPVDASTAPR